MTKQLGTLIVVALGVWAIFLVLRPIPEQRSVPSPASPDATHLKNEAEGDGKTVPQPLPVQENASQPNADSKPASDPIGDLGKIFAEARALLPGAGTINQLSDVHETPRPIVDAAAQLGELRDLEAQYPNSVDEFQRFYESCFHDEQVVPVVRTLCLRNYVESRASSSDEVEALLDEVDPTVAALYRRL